MRLISLLTILALSTVSYAGTIKFSSLDFSTTTTSSSSDSTLDCISDFCKVINHIGNGLANNQPISDFKEDIDTLVAAKALPEGLSERELQIAILELQLELLEGQDLD